MPASTIKAGRKTVTVTNLDKVMYPTGKLTKAQVIAYYSGVSKFLLPHFKGRPVTLIRFPDGVTGKSFYQKNAPRFKPDWVRTHPVPRSEKHGLIHYILIQDLPTLVWAANLAALELHPFLHRAPGLGCPTHVVFDLDPGKGADILTCAEVAFLLRDLLGRLKLDCFPKVSGSKGIQVYLPLNTSTPYEVARPFAHAVAQWLARQHPKLIVSDMAKALRTKKVFIDWSQNHPKKTTIGVYSLRAKREQPFVSIPVKWDELKNALRSGDGAQLFFSPTQALKRLNKMGDLFAPILKLKQRLPKRFLKAPNASADTKSLKHYAAKRDFKITDEPGPVVAPPRKQSGRDRFVVQKHAARQLHYDFRLEMSGVLKSWAVPKGIPLVKGEKRAAFATEDHPVAYLDFEGIIPQGQYGGGTVMVWDIGTYHLTQGNYDQGTLKIVLKGHKLRGEWTLKRLKSDTANDDKVVWLLIKTDSDASPIPKKNIDVSSLTHRTMSRIASDKSAVWQSNRTRKTTTTKTPARRSPRKT